MAIKRRGGLGKGLDRLIPNKSAYSDSAKRKVSPENGVTTNHAEMAPEEELKRKESLKNNTENANSNPIQDNIEYDLELKEKNTQYTEVSEMQSDYVDDGSESESTSVESSPVNDLEVIPEDESIESSNGYLTSTDKGVNNTESIDINSNSAVAEEDDRYVESINRENSYSETAAGSTLGESTNRGESVLIMKISSVEPNRDQPRKHFSEEGIDELASSIKQYGIIQPLLVQKRDDYYEIIAGERRWRAAMKAGLKEVPVIVKDYSNREAVEISLIENIQREDLNPIEEALAYDRLIQEFEMTQEQVAGRVSKSRSAVTNSLRLLKLADDVRQMVIAGDISEGHARTLLGLPNDEMQRLLAERIVKEKLSVRETEKLVKKLTSNTPKKTKARDYQKEAILGNLSEQLKIILGTKVSITEKGKSKGKIEIEYYSDDELNRIFEMLQSLNKY